MPQSDSNPSILVPVAVEVFPRSSLIAQLLSLKFTVRIAKMYG